ncbi:vomeronasal 1 receptor oryCunV1R1582 [Oryctolagus cuniculus]|uniref:Vomeronasal type-1 receptor n=1 Tax=Oryctolagus cuniculus TaxID=9986 RepID=G1TGA7_RABIT|nr:vomeronasal 1 receptor oryCunV1R1582 [Oryctolagus cuniculus]
MDFGDFILRLFFLAQNGIGVLGNTLLLSSYASMACAGHLLRPTHLIMANMAMANFLVLFFKGIPQMIFTWGVVYVLGDAACKLVYYIHRMARGLSLCTTCLLSVFQALTVSPAGGGWMRLKDIARRKVRFSCLLCWVSNLLMNLFIPLKIQARPRGLNSTSMQHYGLCSSEIPKTNAAIYVVLLTFPDVAFMVLMAAASAYMVLLLHRHHKRVKHVHSHSGAHRLSPETKATHTILLLAGTFTFFYFTNSVLTISDIYFSQSHLWLQHVPTFVAACYPTLSPFILMLRDPRALTLCF